MAEQGSVRFRLIRADDVPATNPHGDAYEFGLQDTKGVVHPGRRLADGRLAFDFELRVQSGRNDRPNFPGRLRQRPGRRPLRLPLMVLGPPQSLDQPGEGAAARRLAGR